MSSNLEHVEAEPANTVKMNQFRTLLPQFIAMTGKNLLLIELAMVVAFPTILIPALRGQQPHRYPNETLHFSVEQATWFGSMTYILQPIGSALSGWVTERIGRKRAMLLVNVPHMIGWAMLYFARSTDEVFASKLVLGLGVGFMEAPVITYVGEICQPWIRDILIACSGVALMFGFSFMYLLGAIITWRNVALICVALPIITFTAICFLPESPLWLLSQNRAAEAERSLQWLRGWVPREIVAAEFNEMKRYSEKSNGCMACQKASHKCPHPPADFAENVHELLRKRTLRPFALLLFCFSVTQFSGMTSIRPYMVQLFRVFGVPIDGHWTAVLMGLMGLLANFILMCTIRLIGKRRMYLISLAGSAITCLSLGIYAYNNISMNQSSFESTRTAIASFEDEPKNQNYFAMIMFLCMALCSQIGVAVIPYMLLGEVYPLKTRGMASGLTAAINYLLAFASIKLYANMESFFSIFGTFLFFGCVNIFGLCVLFVILPETEGRSLEEIEQFFSDNKRQVTDRKIRAIVDDANETSKSDPKQMSTENTNV